MHIEDRTIVLTKFRCKNYYSLFIEKLVSEHSSVRAWKKSFPELPDWGDCFANIYKSTKDNLLIYFFYYCCVLMLTVNLLFRWTRVTRGLWKRDCGMASTLDMRETIALMSPNKGKTAVHGCH